MCFVAIVIVWKPYGGLTLLLSMFPLEINKVYIYIYRVVYQKAIQMHKAVWIYPTIYFIIWFISDICTSLQIAPPFVQLYTLRLINVFNKSCYSATNNLFESPSSLCYAHRLHFVFFYITKCECVLLNMSNVWVPFNNVTLNRLTFKQSWSWIVIW